MTLNYKKLKIFYQNVCSLKNKQPQLEALIVSRCYDIIALTETWLSPDISDFLSLPISLGWNYLAKSRPHGLRGGGILLLIAPNLSISKESISSNFELGSLLLGTFPPIQISLIYNPPPAANTDWDALLDSCITPSLGNNSMIILGDFNEASWLKATSNNKLLASTTEHNLTQVIPFPTRGDNYLDLAFIRHLDITSVAQNNCFDSDHQGVEIELTLPNEQPKINAHRLVNDYHRTNWNILNKLIFELNDELVSETNVTETIIDNMICKLNMIITNAIPKRKILKHSLPWMDDELIVLCNKKNRYHKIWKCKKSDLSYQKYAEIRSQFRNKLRLKKDNFMINNQSTHNIDAKKFWKIFKSTNSPGFNMNTNEISATEFASHFSTISNRMFEEPLPPDLDATYNPHILHAIEITPELVNEVVNLSSFHTKSSPDALNGRVMKACASSLSVFLFTLISSAANLGYYPRAWKKSMILPLYKKDDKAKVTNYRQITIQPLAGKALDKLIYISVYQHVLPKINSHIHYSIKGRSINTNLLETTAYILEAFENKKMIEVVYADFEKAFDNVAHNLLLFKLETQFGITGSALSLFTSYFKDRTAYVKWNEDTSAPFPITQGIPQGGILSPLLFSLFTNDIPNPANCKLITYADDVKIMHAKAYNSPHITDLQTAIDILLSWSSKWGLKLNPEKTKTMKFSLKTNTDTTQNEPILFINGTPLERVATFKDLGVTFNTHFTFANHITDLNLKLRRTLGFLKFKFYAINNINTRKILYNALFQAKLDFGLLVWSQAANSNIELIERTHRRALEQFVLKRPRSQPADYHNICKLAEILPIKYRIWTLAIPLAFNPNIAFPTFFQPIPHTRRTSMITRSNNVYMEPLANKVVTTRSLRVTLPKFLNSIPPTLLPDRPPNQYWKRNYKQYILAGL